MAHATNPLNINYFDGMQKLGKTHIHFLWIAAVCYFFDQMDMQMFGFITPSLMSDLGFTLDQIAQMNSMNFLGMCLGGFLGGWIATRIGRKNALLLCVGLFSIGSIINGFTTSYWVFMLMRFIIGFGVIGMVTVAMVYMAEMLPASSRGKYQALSIAAGTIGIPIGALLANILISGLGEHGWRYCFFIGGAGIILIPIGMKWLRESPRWLVSRGRVKEAEAIVSECTGESSDLSEIANIHKNDKPATTKETLKTMTQKGMLKQTIVVCVLSWGATLGVFYMGNYGVTFNIDIGWTYSIALVMSAVGVLGTPAGDVIVSFFSDKGGRRIPIIIFAFGAGIVCVVSGYLLPIWAEAHVQTGSNLPFIGGCVLGIIRSLFCGGMMTLMWTYLAESFPTRIRSNATGLIFGSARLIAVPVTLTVPVTYAAFGYFGVNFINGLWYFIPAIFALLWGRSSAQKSLEQLEAEIKLSM